jgi:hypothetical protein
VKRSQTLLVVLLLTWGALLVHGYHPFAEDAEIYLPGVENILQPGLFSTDARFFESYTHFSLFAQIIAGSVRLSHLSLETALFIWHSLSVFLLLLGCRQLSEECFTGEAARWAGVSTIAALLTLPVAGTALYVMDQYVNPRNLAAFAAIFAVKSVLRNQYFPTGLWICFALAIHPLMGSFVLFLCALLAGLQFKSNLWMTAFLLPTSLIASNSPAYMEAARLHSFHYLFAWRWYEWLGIVAPLGILWWFAVLARNQQRRQIQRLCQALILYGGICLCAAILLSLPDSYGPLARFQPLRSLHLLYLLMFLLIGGFAGEFFLKRHIWRWAVLFLTLSTGMWLAQRTLFPASSHIEWPHATRQNPWARAFLWARNHTDIQAKFALDPNYLYIRGEDTNGFRAIAQRSKLSDAGKDSGEVSMFPNLAERWWTEVQAQRNWQNFNATDFARLRNTYGVNWVVLQTRTNLNLPCPYRNQTIMVCRLD